MAAAPPLPPTQRAHVDVGRLDVSSLARRLTVMAPSLFAVPLSVKEDGIIDGEFGSGVVVSVPSPVRPKSSRFTLPRALSGRLTGLNVPAEGEGGSPSTPKRWRREDQGWDLK